MKIKTASIILTIIVCVVVSLAPTHITQAQDVSGDLLGRINNLRASLGLPGYTLNSALSAAARNQAQWMVQTGQISHTQSNGSTPSSRAAAAGYSSSWVSENIYMGTSATASTAFVWWTNSPIHYRGMTSTNYTEIGIGSASGGNYGSAFVLVFGNPGGWQSASSLSQSSASSGNASGASTASGPPPFVVGLDNLGNIMHEIQPGHTLGEIALIYGYTWDDIQRIRDLNEMTEEQGRNLEVGAVLLIPPYEGTYTPTPGGVESQINSVIDDTSIDADTPYQEDERVREDFDAVSTPRIVSMMGATATPADQVVVIDTPQPQEAVVISAPTNVINEITPREDVANPPIVDASNVTQQANWTAATVTPTVGLTEVAMVDVPDTSAIIPSATVDNTETTTDDNGLSPMIYVIIGVQIGIVGMAGIEFLRRRGN